MSRVGMRIAAIETFRNLFGWPLVAIGTAYGLGIEQLPVFIREVPRGFRTWEPTPGELAAVCSFVGVTVVLFCMAGLVATRMPRLRYSKDILTLNFRPLFSVAPLPLITKLSP